MLLGEPDWAACLDAQGRPLALSWQASPPHGTQLKWNGERQELTLKDRLFKFIAAQNDRAPELKDRRGAARDRFGNWYWIAEAGDELLVNSSGTGRTSHFWSARDEAVCAEEQAEQQSGGEFRACGVEPVAAPLRLGGLAVTDEHYMVVGVIEPAGLLIFDLHAGGPPQQLCWPQTVGFVPFDITPTRGGGLLILDRENRRYWTLDRQFNVLKLGTDEPAKAELFQPLDGEGEFRQTGACVLTATISGDAAFSIAHDGDPIAIEALPDSTVLILFSAPEESASFSSIRRYRLGVQVGRTLSTESVKDFIEGAPEDFRFAAHDFAFVAEEAASSDADRKAGTLYVVSTTGNESFAFEVYNEAGELTLRGRPDYLPLRLFGGKGLVAAGKDVYYDFDDRFIPLTKQKRPRYEFEAVLYTPLNASAEDDEQPSSAGVRGAFDGREPDCVWHRLLIDACIPPETSVAVYSRAANEERDLEIAAWEREPALHLRGDGSELPFVADKTNRAQGSGTWELLFQKARGRFLQLRIHLVGNGRSTPRLRSLRAYYPRFSYLSHYLPGVYREDAESASFLDRFLANLEGFYTTIEDRIAAVQALLDPRGAPNDALDWLAGWFGVALDPSWTDERRRLFIRNAMKFFQWRGTMRGVVTALRLALDPCVDESLFEGEGKKRAVLQSGIRIVEKYRTRTAPGVVFGDPTETGADEAGTATRWLAASTEMAWSMGATTGGSSAFKQARARCGCHGNAPSQMSAGAQGGAVVVAASTNTEAAQVSAAERGRWQAFLKQRYEGDIAKLNTAYGLTGTLGWKQFDEIGLPDDLPQQAKAQSDWLEWVEVVAPSDSAIERKMWQDFLAHRYRSINALNVAYTTRWTKFGVVSLPDKAARPASLQDWNQFVGITLRMRRTAHTFTVMLPIEKTYYADLSRHRERRALAERIVNLEKPAHTVFDVKFYWAMFRVGEARLGDSLPLDQGSRAPQLMPAMTLGQQFLAESYLAPSPVQAVAGRQLVGRDPLRARDAQTKRLTPSG